jgi:hypothetical protein
VTALRGNSHDKSDHGPGTKIVYRENTLAAASIEATVGPICGRERLEKRQWHVLRRGNCPGRTGVEVNV